ncbi:hypothetical protein Tco_0430082 [Tanacetum coccineum]
MPHDLPLLGGHTPGSDEGRLKHDELMELVTKLSDKVVAVEKDLQQTKKTYSTALTKSGLAKQGEGLGLNFMVSGGYRDSGEE